MQGALYGSYSAPGKDTRAASERCCTSRPLLKRLIDDAGGGAPDIQEQQTFGEPDVSEVLEQPSVGQRPDHDGVARLVAVEAAILNLLDLSIVMKACDVRKGAEMMDDGTGHSCLQDIADPAEHVGGVGQRSTSRRGDRHVQLDIAGETMTICHRQRRCLQESMHAILLGVTLGHH